MRIKIKKYQFKFKFTIQNETFKKNIKKNNVINTFINHKLRNEYYILVRI